MGRGRGTAAIRERIIVALGTGDTHYFEDAWFPLEGDFVYYGVLGFL